MGSPVAPSFSEATTCLTYLTYLFTVSAARFAFFILSTTGLTVMLFTFAKGRSPMTGRIHLFSAPFDADQVLNSLPVPTTCPTQILFGLIPKAHFTKNYPVEMLYRVCARSFDYFPRQALDSL